MEDRSTIEAWHRLCIVGGSTSADTYMLLLTKIANDDDVQMSSIKFQYNLLRGLGLQTVGSTVNSVGLNKRLG